MTERIENNLDLRSMYIEELEQIMIQMGEKPFKARQLFDWLHNKRVDSYDEMTNLSRALREKLSCKYPLVDIKVVEVQESRLDGTRKFLFRLGDGNVIESVWMKYHHGNSICISSQAGCRMGCKFCASAIGGLVRSLHASEMLEQIYKISEVTGEKVSNIVVMGTGEPLDNYENLLRFIRLISDARGMNLSQRNITVSTCGIVPKMYELADEKFQITLALSLHAPDDEKRKELMPVANKYAFKEVLDACRYYFKKTGRRITFEYALVAGKNDSERDARLLSAQIRDINCHVNLIPVNPVRERNYVKSDKNVVVNFKNKLEKYRINVTIRREMGSDIDGACGQLRRKYIDKPEEERKT